MNGTKGNGSSRSNKKNKKGSSDGAKNTSHALERSGEFLACAKTVWKIHQQEEYRQLKQQHLANGQPPPPPPPPPPDLQLASTTQYAAAAAASSTAILEDGLALLRSMEFGLKQLQVLVRRRGHTNDPTQEIATLVQQLEQDTSELTDFCKVVLAKRRRSKHSKKHWELVVQWFQQVAAVYGKQLQQALKVRGDVLTEQAQQRKKITNQKAVAGVSSSSAASSKKTATPLFDSPLFTAPPPPPAPPAVPAFTNPASTTTTSKNNGTKNGSHSSSNNPYARNTLPTSSASSGYYNSSGYGGATTGGGYAGGYGGSTGGYGGYGGGGGSSGGGGGGSSSGTGANMGMRNRKGGNSTSNTIATADYDPNQDNSGTNDDDNNDDNKVHAQIQQRKQQRQTQQRLDEAQQAETMLGELGQLFGKMSTLITQQGEQLEKIEDDVEAAATEVFAGQEELTKLYGIKKGNRPLIIKTFAILIFLIVFLRAYKK